MNRKKRSGFGPAWVGALLLVTIHLPLSTDSRAELLDMPLPDAAVDDTYVHSGASAPAVPPFETATVPTLLRIAHPPEGARIPYVRSSFVYGYADPRGRLTVNGQGVPLHPEGGFLAMVPYSTGPFTIRAELALEGASVNVTRRVAVDGPPVVSPATPVTLEFVKPETDLELPAGDTLTVIAKGSPGLEAHFQIEGVHGKFPMSEDAGNGGRGLYRGACVVQPDDDMKDARVRVTLYDRGRGDKLVKEAPGRLTFFDERVPRVVEVSTDIAIVRAGPANAAGDKGGYLLYPPKGVRLRATARRGAEWRIHLSPSRSGWIGETEVTLLPAGTPPPRTTAGTVSVSPGERTTEVRVALGQKAPVEVVPEADGRWIDVFLYGVTSNTDWIHYGGPGGAVSRAEWFQDETDVYRLRVHTAPEAWWGYDTRYEGSTLVLELRSPPLLAKGKPPFEGLTVAVDAGHGADKGSQGPTGLVEKDANLAIAECLRKKLLLEGATVYMIRQGDQSVGLYDRPRLAWQARADLLISVHNNALPEGGNPLERNGYGVYYFHPRSLAFAREIHAAYGEVVGASSGRPEPLRDDGLHYGNLALARVPQMPAVLTESAYVILPREEALLKTATFQCDCAEAMLRGMKRYVRRAREARGGEKGGGDQPAAERRAKRSDRK